MPCARTTATAGKPTTAAAIKTRTTTRMLLPAAMCVNRAGRTPRPPRLARLLQREDEHGRARRKVLDLGPQRGIETEYERAETARHRDVLLAVDGVADGPAAVAGAGAEVPQLLARVGVVRVHDPFEVPVEDEVAAGGQHTPDGRVLEVDGPLPLAGHRITRVEMAVRLASGRMLGHLVAAEEETGRRLGLRRLLLDRDFLAHLHCGVIPELGLRAVRARVPAAAARDPGADERRLADFARRV